MGLESYSKYHWVDIEEDRFDRYEKMFQWGPAFERLLAPADIKPSQIIGDLGYGPGFPIMRTAAKICTQWTRPFV